jgi:AcrR family transcriptional regulator
MAEAAPQTATDKRVQRSKQAVLAETYRQLTEGGIGGVSVDEISRRSGVAKTTIYRHWPSRSALLLDACSQIGAPQPVPDTGSLSGDLRVLTETLANGLRTATWPSILPSIIDTAERDPQVADMHAALHRNMMAPFTIAVERAQTRGELSPSRPSNEIVAALVGPLFYRRWFSKEPLDSQFVEHILHDLFSTTRLNH